ISLGSNDALKLLLTVTNGGKARKPHQAFLTLVEPTTGLEESYPFTIKESGKAKVDLTHAALPPQFLRASKPLTAKIVIGSFGASTPYASPAFSLSISLDPSAPLASPPAQPRYAAQPHITHTFRADPQSPPKVITLVFLLAVMSALPILLGAWAALGANLNDLPAALNAAPISSTAFFGSVVAMEAVFFAYYTSWNLFQTLPVAGVVGVVAFVSGSRALTEVQGRRLAGKR
ncbi:hypothetical protein EJ06DRAFT_472969, partial [Trichodelitschia bisporula]